MEDNGSKKELAAVINGLVDWTSKRGLPPSPDDEEPFCPFQELCRAIHDGCFGPNCPQMKRHINDHPYWRSPTYERLLKRQKRRQIRKKQKKASK